MFMSLLTNTLLYLNLTQLIIKPKVGLKLNLFTKQTNINNFFFQTIHKQFGSFTVLNIITIITYYPKKL